MKKCIECHVTHPQKEFTKLRRGKEIILSKCNHCRELIKRRYDKNPEHVRWRAKNNQKNKKDHRRNYIREYHRRIRKEVIDHLGGKCIRCGFSDPRALQVDHVNGEGWIEHRGKTRLPTYSYSKKVLSYPADVGPYQLLCANCNWIKRYENEEVPYRRWSRIDILKRGKRAKTSKKRSEKDHQMNLL